MFKAVKSVWTPQICLVTSYVSVVTVLKKKFPVSLFLLLHTLRSLSLHVKVKSHQGEYLFIYIYIVYMSRYTVVQINC